MLQVDTNFPCDPNSDDIGAKSIVQALLRHMPGIRHEISLVLRISIRYYDDQNAE
jgi:hypothetical protein